MKCLKPILKRKPRKAWVCPECSGCTHAGVNGSIMGDPLAFDDLLPEPEPSLPSAPPSPPLPPPPPQPRPAAPSHPGVRGSTRARRAPDRYMNVCLTTLKPLINDTHPDHPSDPLTLEEALASPQRDDWIQAINAEINSLFEKGTFEITDREKIPSDATPIGCKWVFKRKYDAFGFLTKYKARLVAKGFLQKAGLDFFEIFSPVSKMTTLRVLLSYVAAKDLDLKQVDVTTAFLNGALEEHVYIDIPPGLSDTYPGKCFKLQKAIYGLKQAPRVWWLNLSDTLTKNGFTPTYSDTCLFTRQGKHGLVLLLVYVDDILVAGHPDDVSSALKVITDNYDCSKVTDASSFLGMRIERNRAAGILTLSQPTYIDDIAKKFEHDPRVHYKKCTPMPDQHPDSDPGPPLPPDNAYASLIGSLLYLANCTRPDICFAVNTLSRHLRAPFKKHLNLALHLLRYVLSTRDYSLVFGKPLSPTKPITLVGYSDSDFANATLPEPGANLTRRSVTGFVFFSNGTPISWQPKKQVTVARSTDEAEYQAMATSASQALWLRKLQSEITPPAPKIPMFCDNMAALTHVLTPGSINKSKHVDIQYQFVLDRHTRGDLEFSWIPSKENRADIFTKALTRDPFNSLRKLLFESYCS